MGAPDVALRRALEKRLAALASPPPIAWENVASGPGSALPRLRATLAHGGTVQEAWGTSAPRMSDDGLLLVDAIGAIGEGPGTVDTLAARVRDHFPAGLVLTEGGVQIRILRTSRAQGRADGSGGYLAPVSIAYRVHYAA